MTLEDLHDLLDIKTENARLDYKERFNWQTSSKSDKCEIIKDILSLSNIAGGGRIVFGVRDSDFNPIGMAQEDYNSFDVTTINAFLRQYTDPVHTCKLFKINDNGRYFIVIEVPEFISEPIICKKDMHTNTGKMILQKGALYIRKESAESTKIDSAIEMRELLTRALKHRSDELLKSIQTLLSERPPSEVTESLCKDTLAIAMTLVDDKIEKTIIQNESGFLSVTMQPYIDLTSEIGDLFTLRERIHRSQVSFRGWTFPHEQRNKENGDCYNISDGILSYTQWERHVESFCIFTNGLFYWKSAFWEDSGLIGTGEQNTLSFVSLIYHSLEFLLFANMFYDFSKIKPDITLNVILNKCSGRRLKSFDPSVFLIDDYVCGVDRIDDVKVAFNIVESIANPKQFSAQIVNKIFEYFNFQMKKEVLEQWQNKYLSRSL